MISDLLRISGIWARDKFLKKVKSTVTEVWYSNMMIVYHQQVPGGTVVQIKIKTFNIMQLTSPKFAPCVF